MDFKIGDWVITSEDCYFPNAVGFVTGSIYNGFYVSNKENLELHTSKDNGDFHLCFSKEYLKPYNKEQQLELNFE